MAASLHQIARGGDVEEGEKFFREVTDSRGEKAANTVDGMQRTPLHLACWAGKAGMIGLLLEHRADCMAEAQDGFTPLHFCSQAGCAEGCRLLLQAGAKVDAKLLKTKKTPLHFAAGKGHVEAVRVLIQAGADPSSETSKGQTPLHLASKHPDVRAALAGEEVGEPPATAPASSAPAPAAAAAATTAGGVDTSHGGEKAGGGSGSPADGETGASHGATETKRVVIEGEGEAENSEVQGGGVAPTAEGGAGGGVERSGSLAERRRKKRKLAKAAAAAATAAGNGAGVSLSHLDEEGGDGDVDEA